MFAFNFYIPTINESDGSYVYYGESDPNTITEWSRDPQVGDRYIQSNDDIVSSIEWTKSESDWFISDEITFFISTDNGVIITPGETITLRSAYKVNGNVFYITETSTYNEIVMTDFDNAEFYEKSISYEDVQDKYVIKLINISNNNIIDIIEIIKSSLEYDNTPPDNSTINYI